MNTQKIKATLLAVAIMATAGLTACDTGTSPGETNVERSEIREEGAMIGEEGENTTRYSDTTDLERYYDEAGSEEGSAVHAGDGKGEGVQRDEADNN